MKVNCLNRWSKLPRKNLSNKPSMRSSWAAMLSTSWGNKPSSLAGPWSSSPPLIRESSRYRKQREWLLNLLQFRKNHSSGELRDDRENSRSASQRAGIQPRARANTAAITQWRWRPTIALSLPSLPSNLREKRPLQPNKKPGLPRQQTFSNLTVTLFT